MKAFLKRLVVLLYRLSAGCFPVERTKVVFASNMGKNYAGNPKAVFEGLRSSQIASEKQLKLYWVLNRAFLSSHPGFRIEGAVIVPYGSFKYYYLMATASIWVFDTRQEPYIIKKKNQFYLQTWHGTPLKKLGLDIEENHMAGENRTADYRRRISEESLKWDVLVAPNRFSAEIFPGCFDYKGKLLLSGYPRNDELARCKKENCGNNTLDSSDRDLRKVLLYAPTWRDDEYLEGGWYCYNRSLDLKKLEQLIGAEYRLIIKLHYLVKLAPGDIPAECLASGFVSVVGSDADINSCYIEADALITDYSSVMFDYSILQRPIFFFVYDLENYRDKLRGFYFELEKEAPGPIVRTTEELADAIINYNAQQYRPAYDRFREKYATYEDGNATERVINELLLHM